MSLRYHPCLLCGQKVAYLKKLKSYRPILPKIVLEVSDGEPVDPQPAQLVSEAERKAIECSVEEAVIKARKRHESGNQKSALCPSQ